MPLRYHTDPVTRYAAEIVTSDPVTKTVQALMRTGPVHISVYTTEPFFRWPKTGENWMVRRENGSWYLDGILQESTDTFKLQNCEPGDVHLNVPGKIHTNQGTTLPQKYTATVGLGTKFTIDHQLHTHEISVSAIKILPDPEPLAIQSWKFVNEDEIEVKFAEEIKIARSVKVIVIG